MNRSLGRFAVVALLATAGCATGGRPEPRFAQHHSEPRGEAVAGLIGNLAELVASIAEIKEESESDEADAPVESVREQPDEAMHEAMPFATGEIPHQPPRVTAPDPQRTPFDAPAAREAIAAANVSACLAHGAPAGYVHARVTFGDDGAVTDVGLDGAAMSPEATACLDAHLREVTMPPFDGRPTTVGASLLLR